MVIQLRKRRDGQIELMENMKVIALLTKEQAQTLGLALQTASK